MRATIELQVLVLATVVLTHAGPATSALVAGNIRLYDSTGTVCANPCTSGLTTVSVDSVLGDTITLSVATLITAPDQPDFDAPTLRLDFDLAGRTDPIHFVEHVTNSGTLAWEEWAQTAAPFHWDPAWFPLLTIGPVLAPAFSLAWANVVADIAGIGQTFLLPATPVYEDPVLGTIAVPGDTLAGAVFRPAGLLGAGATMTVYKDLLFSLAPDACAPFDTGCESGVVQVALTFTPAAVPLPLALPGFLGGLVAVSLIGSRRRRAARDCGGVA